MTDQISFDPLLDLIDSVANLTNAFQRGNAKFINYLPIYFKETTGKLAGQRLNHTAPNFNAAVEIDIQSDVLVVTLNPKDWLANAVESGADSFPMVRTHLSGSKVKTSKEGYKYKVIPLRVWTTSPSARTDKGQELFEKIQNLLKKPKFGKQTQTQNPNGSVSVRQAVQTDDSALQGMYRVREYASQDALLQGARPKQSQYVLFRTISEKHPEKFVHPGIKPANILKDSLTIVENSAEQQWDQMIQSELQKKGFS